MFHYLLSLAQKKELAEDLVQETFYRALIYLETYKDEDIRPWLFRVARNTFIDWYRKEKQRQTVYLEEWHLPQVPSAEEKVLHMKELESWFQFLEGISASKRSVLLLKDYYGFSYEEISEVTGYSVAKVKMDLFRGRQDWKKQRGE